MRLCVLASSSSGNSVLVESESTRVLVDVGLSWSRVSQLLRYIDVDASTIGGIVVSHEHTDHTAGVGPAARKIGCPVYINPETLSFCGQRLAGLSPRSIVPIDVGRPFAIGDLEFTAFPVPHDAANPVGFVVRSNSATAGIATDLGYPTKLVKECLFGCNVLVLESNHDTDMLWNGPYPWELKQRIAGRLGHLSNDQSAALLSEVLHNGLAAVVLCHLSVENNTPDLAYGASAATLLRKRRTDVAIELSYPDRPSAVVLAG